MCKCSMATKPVQLVCFWKLQVPAHTYLTGRQDADEKRASWNSRLLIKVSVSEVGDALFDVWHTTAQSDLVSSHSKHTFLQPNEVRIREVQASMINWGERYRLQWQIGERGTGFNDKLGREVQASMINWGERCRVWWWNGERGKEFDDKKGREVWSFDDKLGTEVWGSMIN